MIDVADEADDIASLHLQAQVVGADLAELHELVDELRESSDTPLGCLHGFPLGVVFLAELIHSPADDGQRRAELMGHLREEVGTELRHLLLDLHLLMEFEALAPVAVEGPSDGTQYNKVERPGPPRIVPGLTDGDVECSLIAIVRRA